MTTLRYSNPAQNILLDKMYAAVKNKTAQPLTLEAAKDLIGKRIQTIYFGYKGQDGINDFVVAHEQLDIKKRTFQILNSDGKETFIRCHLVDGYYPDTFTCSDVDRIVYFIEVETKGTEECLIPFFEHVQKEYSYPFMAGKIYGRDEKEEKIITHLLIDLGISNPYPSDYQYNELRHRMWLWQCVNTTNWLIAEGKEVDPEVNPTEWRMWP